MGSMLSRYMRDLTELAGCEIVSDSPSTEFSTPVSQKVRQTCVLDPRSPSADIARTPIEVSPLSQSAAVNQSPVTSLSSIRRSYLETDLDSLTTKELDSKPEEASVLKSHEHDLPIPAGLSSTHFLKLRFLGMDPRSPSSGIVRTPIQVSVPREHEEKNVRKFQFDDSVSLGSISSQEMYGNSTFLSDFTRECTDPSVFVSECEEDLTDKLDSSLPESTEGSPAQFEADNCSENQKNDNKLNDMNDSSVENPIKGFAKLSVFCEDDSISAILPGKTLATPDNPSAKKNVRNRSRTPLTPLCNRNITPNGIIRAKQSQIIEKEKLTKVKIYNGAEKVKTPSTQITALKDSGAVSTPRKKQLVNDENAPAPDTTAQARAQWDLDTSIVI